MHYAQFFRLICITGLCGLGYRCIVLWTLDYVDSTSNFFISEECNVPSTQYV